MGRLTNAFVGRDTQYFDLFEAAATNVVRAAELLEQMLAGWPDSQSLARDILELASSLDDIADFTEEVADFLGLYKIEAPMDQAGRMAEILVYATRQIAQAMPRLREYRDISHFTIEIHRLENDGDRVTREAMAALFDHGIDPMTVIRWKDIYERLEAAIDATEKTANILESIVIKNA